MRPHNSKHPLLVGTGTEPAREAVYLDPVIVDLVEPVPVDQVGSPSRIVGPLARADSVDRAREGQV